jgi:hypothetical protein
MHSCVTPPKLVPSSATPKEVTAAQGRLRRHYSDMARLEGWNLELVYYCFFSIDFAGFMATLTGRWSTGPLSVGVAGTFCFHRLCLDAAPCDRLKINAVILTQDQAPSLAVSQRSIRPCQ